MDISSLLKSQKIQPILYIQKTNKWPNEYIIKDGTNVTEVTRELLLPTLSKLTSVHASTFGVNTEVAMEIMSDTEKDEFLKTCKFGSEFVIGSNYTCDIAFSRLYKVYLKNEPLTYDVIGILNPFNSLYHLDKIDKLADFQDYLRNNTKFSSKNGCLYTYPKEEYSGSSGFSGKVYKLPLLRPLTLAIHIAPPKGGTPDPNIQQTYINKYNIKLDGFVGCKECEVAIFANKVHEIIDIKDVTLVSTPIINKYIN
jgi:hypothetical protein